MDVISAEERSRSEQLAVELHQTNHRRIDRIFVGLMLLQWGAGILTAMYLSPYTWIGERSLVHTHVWAALFLGGLISAAPVALGIYMPGHTITRHVIAISQALWGALLIHLSGGRIETHFHVFGSLAFIAFYRDWKVLMTMTIVVATDHAVRGIFFPLSVYGVVLESPYRWLEHAAWVAFEDVFLLFGCLRGQAEATALCNQQAQLEASNASIEETVRVRSEQLRVAKVQAEDALVRAETANKQKGQFLANMSHELRTPLNGVMGMLDLLMDTKLTNRQGEYAAISRESARSLLSIINDILDYSKIEAEQLVLEAIPFDLARMLEEIAALGAAQVAESEVEVVLNYSKDMPRGVVGDPLRLRQVMTNLLNNALKFTKSGHVVLEALHVGQEGDHTRIRFAIRDTGVGIPKDQLGQIFHEFTQADGSTTREFGGTGLGLAISSHLVELMDSEIVVTSTLGEGSEFSFEVLMERAGLGESAEDYTELSDARVLVVDDLKLNREILVAQLIEHVAVVEAVASAKIALETLREANPAYDVVVTDYQMPVTDGQQLGQTIRSDDTIYQPKLVLLSSDCTISQTQLTEIGFADYLIKPASRNVLLASICGTLVPERSGPQEEPAELQVPAFKLYVLVADDNLINQLVAKECLANMGCSVDVCGNGREALDLVRANRYDLVFMDCHMPEMDGYEASRRIRALDEPKRSTPIVALTANALTGDKEVCLEAGMDDHVSKPFQPGELLSMIVKYSVPVEEPMVEPLVPVLPGPAPIRT